MILLIRLPCPFLELAKPGHHKTNPGGIGYPSSVIIPSKTGNLIPTSFPFQLGWKLNV